MKIIVSEMEGAALDRAVAQCEKVEVEYVDDGITRCLLQKPSGRYAPSTDWSQGGPIIEREGMSVGMVGEYWQAHLSEFHLWMDGPTPLIAAMRCYVASKMGDEIKIAEV